MFHFCEKCLVYMNEKKTFQKVNIRFVMPKYRKIFLLLLNTRWTKESNPVLVMLFFFYSLNFET